MTYFSFKNVLLFFFAFFISNLLISQEKQLDHTVYNNWKSLRNQKISDPGGYISYEINPHRGDGYLYIFNTSKSIKDSIHRGKKADFSHSEDVFAFLIDPGYDTIRELQLQKVKKEKMVRDSLGILFLQKDSLVKVPNVLSFQIPENGNWLVYTVLSDSMPEKEVKEKRFRLFGKKKPQPKTESKGNHLFLVDIKTGKTRQIKYVSHYSFNDNGSHLFYITQKTVDKKDSLKINLIDLNRDETYRLDQNFSSVTRDNFSKKGRFLTFLASNDSVKENKSHQLYYWSLKDTVPQLVADSNRADLPSGLRISANSTPFFSLDETKLFFGLEEIPSKKEKDTLLESEKAKVDVWHYEDKRLQPQQLKELKRDETKSYVSVIDLTNNTLTQLGNDTLNVRVIDQGNSDRALGISSERYAGSYNWSFPWPKDYYLINLKNGTSKLLKENVGYSMGLSPDGNYFVYFNSEERQYKFIDTKSGEEDCITCFIKDSVNWQRDINGMPHDAGTFSIAGYTKTDKNLLLHSEFDVWEYDFRGRRLTSFTKKRGEQTNTELRLKRWEYDSTYVDLNNIYIHGFNRDSKNESIYGYVNHGNHSHLNLLKETPHKLFSIEKADNSTKVIYRKMNVKDYPDLYLTNTNFDTEEKVSNANPQQAEYIWSTVERIKWTSYEGKKLEGLIYKPEDFDSTKSYPLLVYFYELYSDKMNHHYVPKPTASVIYPTEYASAGYVVFIPDIRYDEGYPARGAYDCIMSGTDEVLKKYSNIDSTRMGLQGQSWGGYQTAQLITMTDRYKAAMAGAPVSNMFSAYGGIRWGSGLNRQFQYEKTQSRIGKTIWEAPELYIENSPLFGIPDIETPLLIMHNDGDGAVPWYQGIEMFVGMKRLGKPVWLLNYNEDQHNLMKDANRMDLSIRMRQFFDYYLMDEPAPKWLIEGVPALDKGVDYGLEEYTED